MDAFQILVIILAVFLALFLVLGITLLILCIRISLKIKRITENLEDASDNMRRLMAALSQLSSPAIAIKILAKFIRSYINTKRRNTNNE